MLSQCLILIFSLHTTRIYAFENYPDCGIAKSGTSGNSNGQPTSPLHFPWAAALMRNKGEDLHCSGSIISSRFILTASHCLFMDGRKIDDKTKLEILLGAGDLKETSRRYTRDWRRHQMKDFWLHDRYDQSKKTIDYDIAIIEVTPEIKFEPNLDIWPVCIPTKPNKDKDHLKWHGIQVVGYGPTEEKEEVLTIIDLTVMPIDDCNNRYSVPKGHNDYRTIKDELPQKFNNGSAFCAIRYGKADGTCEGDSGGPALSFKGQFNEQVGVVHGNIRKCDGTDFPDIFVRLDNEKVFEWINRITSGRPKTIIRRPLAPPQLQTPGVDTNKRVPNQRPTTTTQLPRISSKLPEISSKCGSNQRKGKEHCNAIDLCMTIVANENGILSMHCYDRSYNIDNKIEWEINSKIVSSQSCMVQNWSDLNLGGRNIIICRVKQHPGTPRWQEIRGWVYRQEEFDFKLN